MLKVYLVLAAGIIVAIAVYLVVDKYMTTVKRHQELTASIQRATIQAYTNQVQAAVNIFYARSAIEGKAAFPAELADDMFIDGKVPPSNVGKYYWEYDPVTGKVSSNID